MRDREVAGGEWDGAWIDTIPVARLGEADNIPLYQVRGAVLFGDTIVVAERSTGKLHFFNRTGEFIKSAGGLGGGPGESEYLWGVQRLGEHLYTYDVVQRRVSQFASDGSLLRTFRIDPVEEYTNVFLAGVFADRSLLVVANIVHDGQVQGAYRRRVVLLRYDSTGAYVDSLHPYFGGDLYAESTPTYNYSGQIPFGRRTISLPYGSHYYLLENNDYSIGVFDQDGMKVRELRPQEEPPEPVTPEHSEAIRKYYGPHPDLPSWVAPKMVDLFDRLPIADTFPPYGWYGNPKKDLKVASVSSVGDLWVLNGDELPGWTVFTEDGSVRGHVRALEVLDVLDADDEIAVVLRWDELDVETVEVRRIRR